MMNFNSLQIIASTQCNKDITNKHYSIIPLYLWYNFNQQEYLFKYILNDILAILNHNKDLNTFQNLYKEIIKYINKTYIDSILSNYKNNHYLRCNFFSDILLHDLSNSNLVYKSQVYSDSDFLFSKHSYFNYYNEGEPVISPSFKKNFNKYTENIFDDFNWSNCVVAGGLANKITDKNFDANLRNGLYELSDIDIFLYGKTYKKKQKIVYILNFMRDKLGRYYLGNYPNVLSLFFPEYHLEIQIVIGNYKSPLQIINDFDLSHLQMYYDGKTIRGTQENMIALETRTTKVMKNKINIKLITKIYNSGFALVKTEYIAPLFKRIIGKIEDYHFKQKIDKTIKWCSVVLTEHKKYKFTLFFQKRKTYLPTNISDCLNYISVIKNISRDYMFHIEAEMDIKAVLELSIDYTNNFTKSKMENKSFYD